MGLVPDCCALYSKNKDNGKRGLFLYKWRSVFGGLVLQDALFLTVSIKSGK
jgi:hypothetical protein